MAEQDIHSSSSDAEASGTRAESPYQDQHAHRRSLFRTRSGKIAFPGEVPPPILGPDQADHDEEPKPQPQPKTRQRSSPLPGPDSNLARSKTASSADRMQRPRPPRRTWQTELGRRRPLKKTTSYLDHAIQQGCDQEADASSSSDEDDESVPGPVLQPPAVAEATEDELPVPVAHDADKAPPKKKRFNWSAPNSRFHVGNENYFTKGKVKKDGRLRITVKETATSGYIAKALGSAVSKMVPAKPAADETAPVKPVSAVPVPASPTEYFDTPSRPRLNIVIMVIGSRGDAQPFLKIGRILKEEYGHRVRIATHPAFREFVERDSGLEFFSVGGDPAELMAFMVKNPGMIPTLESVKQGEVGRRRAAMAEMFEGFWRACINATDNEKDTQNLKMMGSKRPFVADAIIANPPSFAHMHCAEALGIPLHLMFTFPYTPTQAFPHPLASIKRSNVDPGYTNFISYPLVEMMVWQGLGDLVNDFRVKTLALDPVSTLWAPGATYRMHVPFSYLWSPGLVPKPQDWGSEIDISGFVFLDLASSFKPPQDLLDFLDAGEPPVYIGFGSIVVDDADGFTRMIFEAVKKAGVRALVSKGWGGFGGGGGDVPDNIFMLENTPHDWLFPRVKACVIHGGAGTTAMALKCGKPTMVVPFFGDQYFWGTMLGSAGAGPEPVPHKQLTADKLADGINFCLTDEAREAAGKISESIKHEGDGAENAVKSFHKHLKLRGPDNMRCSILNDHIAVWQPKGTHIRLSALAADILVSSGYLSWRRLRLLRHCEWNDFEGPGEPVTGVAGSVAVTVQNAFRGVGGVPYRIAKKVSKNNKKRRTKKERKLNANGDVHKSKQINGTGQNRRATNGNVHPHSSETLTNGNEPDVVSIRSESTANANADDMVGEVTGGFGQTASAIAKAPVDLSVALAQGFHNAPRLYGDDTVRKPPRVTGIHSGFHAARKEFGYGIYDGWTGLVRQPVRGAKNNGALGFVKGTGIGLTGFVLKNVSAIVGPFGYALKGLVKQAERSKAPRRSIRRARIAQGQREAGAIRKQACRREVHDEIVAGWRTLTELHEATVEAVHKHGLAKQINMAFLDTAFMFDDVDAAARALQALKGGQRLDQLVRRQRQRAGGGEVQPEQRQRSDTRRSRGSLPRRSTGEPAHGGCDRRDMAYEGGVCGDEEGYDSGLGLGGGKLRPSRTVS